MNPSAHVGHSAIGIGVVLVLSLSAGAARASGQSPFKPVEAVIINPPGQPVPITAPTPIPVTAPTPLAVSIVSNRQSFTIPPTSGSLTLQGIIGPADPSGTQYAITSVTVSNSASAPQVVMMKAVAGDTLPGSGCLLPFNIAQTAAGPEVTVPANNTVHLSFPEAFVTAAVSGPGVCLAANANPANAGVTWSAVGYKILP